MRLKPFIHDCGKAIEPPLCRIASCPRTLARPASHDYGHAAGGARGSTRIFLCPS
jgi:hypothetical protein